MALNINKRTAIYFLILTILSGGTSCMKKELDINEKDLLKNIESFNKNIGERGWEFKNRKVVQ